MGKIYLNGVDYSAPVGGGDNSELKKGVDDLEEKTKGIGSDVSIKDNFAAGDMGSGSFMGCKKKTGLFVHEEGINKFILEEGGISKTGISSNNAVEFGGYQNDGVVKIPFSFGVDENGNYGYIKAGADTVTPFRQSINYDVLPDTANAIGGGTDILINIPIIRGIDIQRTAVINDNDAIYTLFLLLNKNIDKYYPISEYPNLSVYYSSPSYIVSQEHPTLYASFPIRSLTNVDDLLQYIPDGDNVNKIKTLIDFFDIRYFTFSKGNNFMDNSAFYMSVISSPSSYNAEYRYKASTLVIQFLQPNNDLIISTL